MFLPPGSSWAIVWKGCGQGGQEGAGLSWERAALLGGGEQCQRRSGGRSSPVLCRSRGCHTTGEPLPTDRHRQGGDWCSAALAHGVALCCVLAGIHEGLQGALGTRGRPCPQTSGLGETRAGVAGDRGLCWPEAAGVEAGEWGMGGSTGHRGLGGCGAVLEARAATKS